LETIFFFLNLTPKIFTKNPKTIQSKKRKIHYHVFTLGTFLQNYRKIYQAVSKIQAGTDDGRTEHHANSSTGQWPGELKSDK
jgi:hypothetical protein